MESTGTQGITFDIPFSLEDKTTVEYMLTGSSPASGTMYHRAFGGTANNGSVSNGASGSAAKSFAWNSTCYLAASSTSQSIWAAGTSFLAYKIQLRAKNTAVLTNGKITLNGYSRTGEKVESDVSFTSGYQLFGWGGGSSFGSLMRVYSFKHERNGKMLVQLVPALDETGTPCMFDLVRKRTFRNSGKGQFIVGLTREGAAQLGRKLTSTGGSLTVSLPEGYDFDECVVNSLAEAEAKGWVLTIQTYAAETAASTFALRRVWVRREQAEHGSYVAADGSRWLVEWCVDIIGADPASLGYERFRSVEAATAYWELEPYIDPNAEELLTVEEQS